VKALLGWFVRNGVVANLLIVVIAAGGLLTVGSLRKEIVPDISMGLIVVSVPYPGASPEEVEKAICVKVEEELYSIERIRRMSSTAAESVGTVVLELEAGADIQKALDEAKSRVDAITTFPQEAEKPVVREVTAPRRVINVAVAGDVDEKTLHRLADRVRDELTAIPGITQVALLGSRDAEISIEVSEERLRRHGLTFDDVARAVRRSSLDLPGGSVRTDAGEILVRTPGQATSGAQFASLPVLATPEGARVTVGDVATVLDGFADTGQASRFNGRPALLLSISAVGDQSALAISEAVRAYASQARQRMPEGVEITTWADDARILRERLDLLVRNGRMGLVLVFFVLALFLRLRLAFWVTFGIPIAMLGALWCMPSWDLSINLMSLFAFILVLGMLVDDGIVVAENIYTHLHLGRSGADAATEGVHEVWLPVVLAVATTMVAFIPMLMIPGPMGQFARAIPIVVVLCLAFSVAESLLSLPSHLSHMRPEEPRGPWARFQAAVQRLLAGFVNRAYRPVLDATLRWRYATIATGLAFLLLTGAWFAGGRIKFDFFPPVEAENIVAQITLPQGTPAEVTQRVVARIEESVRVLRAEVEKDAPGSVFKNLLSSVGSQPWRAAQRGNAGAWGRGLDAAPHLAEVNLELTGAEGRPVTATALAQRWRELVGPIPDAVEATFTSSLFSSGEAINVELRGADLPTLRAAAADLKEKLAQYPGVHDISDTYRAGKRQLDLDIAPDAEALGLARGDLARQVRQGFHGEEVQRVQRGRDDVRVMIRYPDAERRSVGDIEKMRIRLPGGIEVPFSEVAIVQSNRGPASIQRADRRRTISVLADVDRAKATPNDVIAGIRRDVLPGLLDRHPGITFGFEGEQRHQSEVVQAVLKGFALAMLGIYALLAIPLRSYTQPGIILVAVPFGIAGAVWAHVALGMNITMLSLIGILALSGVVVNDAVVLMDFINRARASGRSVDQAIHEAGPRRFRPILLTSITTFAGLVPMVLERSIQAQFLVPMAVSLAFGVLFCTGVNLLLVPSVYRIIEDMKDLFRRPVAATSGASSPPGSAR
jgi:multidrug efflux pump subunit AcrB